MLDHVRISVSDLKRSRMFYRAALAPLGYRVLADLPGVVFGGADIVSFGVPPEPDLWLLQGVPNQPPVHLSFRAEQRAYVDEFYVSALAAGGRAYGKPSPRSEVHEHCYSALVTDFDGHHIEVMCRERAFVAHQSSSIARLTHDPLSTSLSENAQGVAARR